MMNDLRISLQWEHWCKQAADKAGINVEELKKKLENDEACLEISFKSESLPDDDTLQIDR